MSNEKEATGVETGVGDARTSAARTAEAADAATAVPRDAAYWAPKVERLSVTDEVGAHGYNVAGRRVTGPQQGFGRLWQRTYWTDLGGAVTPRDLIADWRAHFGDFWPRGAKFHGALTGIEPGDVAALELGPGHGLALATGIMVLYADEESFTFMTPEGHMFAGMITFSGEADDDGATTARIRILLRTNDPLYELGWPIMKRAEDVFWAGTLRNLATSHGVAAEVHAESECLDKRRIWKNWRNVWHNAGIRSAWHTVTSPFRSSSSAATAG